MNDELDKLERDVERDMRLLRDLPVPAPRPECLARVKIAVSAEARRVMRRRRLLRWTGSGAAAAVLLVVVGITFWHGRQARGPGNDAGLNEWAAALDESNARLARLFAASAETGEDEAAELDDLLQGLDQSLQYFEDLESG